MKFKIGGKELEIADELVTKAIEEKSSVEVSGDYVIRTTDEETQFKNNFKTEHITAGKEIGMKEFKKLIELDIEGKDPKAIAEAFKAKIESDAKIEPDKKVEALMKDIETLKGTLSTKDEALNGLQSQFSTFKNETILNNTFGALIPDNTVLPKDDVSLIIRNRIKTSVDENGNVVVLDAQGNIKKDGTTLDPVPLKKELETFFAENPTYLKGASGGAGGDDSKRTGNKQTTTEFTEEMRGKGVMQGTKAFVDELTKRSEAELIED